MDFKIGQKTLELFTLYGSQDKKSFFQKKNSFKSLGFVQFKRYEDILWTESSSEYVTTLYVSASESGDYTCINPPPKISSQNNYIPIH